MSKYFIMKKIIEKLNNINDYMSVAMTTDRDDIKIIDAIFILDTEIKDFTFLGRYVHELCNIIKKNYKKSNVYVGSYAMLNTR